METLLAIVTLIDVCVIIFYRLMVNFYYVEDNNVKESHIAAIFSFPQHSKLSENGKHYCKRYWLAVTVLFPCLALLIAGHYFSV